jgi:tetratricopeptide (TPR) repeat protein
MTSLYIIAGIITLIFILNYFRIKKENNSPYFKIKKKLEDDLKVSNFSGNWKNRQVINLQLLWLDTIKGIETRDFLGNQKEQSENSILSKLDEDSLKYPIKWKLDNVYHLPLVQGIISGYGKTLAENDYRGIYKPNNILPYPKDIIKKAHYYMFDYLNYDKPLYKIEEKKKYADSLNVTKLLLDLNFIDTGNDDLPKEILDNMEVGKDYNDKQPSVNEVDELSIVDWLDSHGWLLKGARYAKMKQWDFSIPCYLRSLELEPHNSQTLLCLGLVYNQIEEFSKAIEIYNKALIYKPDDEETLYHLANSLLYTGRYNEAISYYKKVVELNPSHGSAYNNLGLTYSLVNQPILELENMKIAAQLGVEKAIEWITQKGISLRKVEKILKTKNTPEVILNPEGKIEIKGRSIPEDAVKFYNPIEDWVSEYIINPADITYIDINLECINGASTKYLIHIIQKITYVTLKHKKFVVNWYYKTGDEDILEIGKSFSSDLDIRINFIQLN